MAGFVEMNHVYKRYQMGEVTITALSDVNFSIQQGEFVVIVGPLSLIHIFNWSPGRRESPSSPR